MAERHFDPEFRTDFNGYREWLARPPVTPTWWSRVRAWWGASKLIWISGKTGYRWYVVVTDDPTQRDGS